jgi:hypothetical protein
MVMVYLVTLWLYKKIWKITTKKTVNQLFLWAMFNSKLLVYQRINLGSKGHGTQALQSPGTGARLGAFYLVLLVYGFILDERALLGQRQTNGGRSGKNRDFSGGFRV